jgi:hypothetical protein
MSIDYQTFEHIIPDSDLDRERPSPTEKSTVERLLDELEAHERSERELLEDYSNAAAQMPDRGVRFVMGLILEDETRHHRLMAAMAEDIRSSVEWLHKDGVPSITAGSEARKRLLADTERFLEIERTSADELKELKKAVKHLNTGMLAMLVETMEADTHKHIGMLKYVRKQLDEA